MRGYFYRYFTVLIIVLSTATFIPIGTPAATTPVEGGNQEETSKPPAGESNRTRIESWLLLGPIPSPFPAFHDEGDSVIDAAYLLSYRDMPLEEMKPIEGRSEILICGGKTEWKVIASDTIGVQIPADTSMPHIAYLAAYIEVPRWTKISIEARATQPFEITVGGTSVVKCKEGGKQAIPEKKEKGKAKIERGKHLLIAKTVCAGGETQADWRLDVQIGVENGPYPMPELSLCPSRNLALGDILGIPYIEQIRVSPDGSMIAFTARRFSSPEGDTERWAEIRSLSDGALLRTIKDLANISNVQWAPAGKQLSYTTYKEDKGTIRVLDIKTGTAEPVIENVKGLGNYIWGADGSLIIYSITEKAEKDKKGVKRLRGIHDRWNYGRDRSYLYISSFPGGITRRLTAGKYNSYIQDISSDGRTALITRHYEDLSDRPYGKDELILMNLENQSTELLYSGPWLRRAMWSPDGDKILVLAGPSTFGEEGKNVVEGKIPNDYDTQAYIFDPETKKVDPITKDFCPSIVTAQWSGADGNIYFTVEEKSFRKLYRYNPGRKSFHSIKLGFEYLSEGHMALKKPVAVLVGSSTNHPPRLYSLDLRREKLRLILDPSEENFRYIKLGKVEDWNFTSKDGKVIEGRIHYPPGFDSGKNYPCIVYYYGGTSPTSRTFGGRYPKSLWAAMGYVVYVLQPSGATGFGQEFSSFHVNDWGKIVSGEIIEGVSKFLDEHPFVDRGRVGCIGASYGGFMTQLLVTKTDIFAAAISHAGISSITSYWGEGYWGYAYNSVAAANSFPWNRRDIYIDQSPLFSADRINTPLLLLHGASDTNVPPGESEQMYVALKLLGKEVEYIRFAEQNHFILDFKKRNVWSNSIVAWFDRWLKDEPEWWNDMYPRLDGGKPAEPKEMQAQLIELGESRTALMGEVTRDDIARSLPGWDAEYFEYTPDGELLLELEQHISDVNITCILGTWCSDSKREIPRLWRILDKLQYPPSDMRMLAVGSSRFTSDMSIPADLLDWSDDVKSRYGIERVATIILIRDNKEIGRIVESPEESLEKDLLKILKK